MKFSPSMRNALRELLVERSLRVGQTVTLSTGRLSNFYFNCKPVTLSSRGAPLLAEAFLDKLALLPQPIFAVGGRTLGADPIVEAVLMRVPARGFHLEGFLVREKQKQHGTKERIANTPPAGSRVAIVDDVVTTGSSVIDAIEAVQAAGSTVVGVVVLVDRQEEDGAANIRKYVNHYHAIFTRQDFPEIGDSASWDTTNSEKPSSILGDSSSITSGK